ncbi:MAG: carbohydrate kinase [Cyclobacteriaceae bacterium]|nr:carbohydrate kinase [Cyclobacteriaceae bacterium]
MKNYCIAVLDIGKTNKKILIYDQDLKIVDEKFIRIPEIEEDNVQYDDVESLKSWILSTFSELSGKYDIRAIATSAHGATYSLVGEEGNHAVPQVAYTTDPGEALQKQFYNLCGDPIALQSSTATPNFNLLINPAKGIYFSQQKFPEQFAQAKHLLFYPQFFGHWLTGEVCADPTYAGNHTYLWDFEQSDWSQVADKLHIRNLLPKVIKNPWDVMGTIKPEIALQTGLHGDTLVTVGIHDSNASMLPYLISEQSPFLLNSTGTWCVIMNEKDQVRFEKDELGKVVFYNLNAFGRPVKTAIFLGGMEFEFYAEILQKIHKRTDFPAFNEQLVQQIIDDKTKFILPSVAKGIGQFPESEARVVDGDQVYALEDIRSGRLIPGFFHHYEEALAVLNLSLAIQTKVSFDRAGITPGMNVFTEGGFAKNDSYNALLTAFYPDSQFFLTDLKQASAFGAAITGKAAYEQADVQSLAKFIRIDKKQVKAGHLENLNKYYERFISLI